MKTDAIIGLIVLVVALGTMTWLVWWSRRAIRRLAERPKSAREALRELHDEP